jgi:hypothetical protein
MPPMHTSCSSAAVRLHDDFLMFHRRASSVKMWILKAKGSYVSPGLT